tara:strand:+ start:2887 stop:3213 length:327 start_codon:yes stop_codon:yes gene_type:complete
MFKKSIIFSITFFFLLTTTTSLIKNKARNLEKDILKLKKDISFLEKQISDAEIDFIYLSNPEQLTKHLTSLKKEKYSTFHHSRIFFSINHFLKHDSKISKYMKNNIIK